MIPDVIATVSAVAALVGAGVAVWQAVSARHDRKAAQAASADAARTAAEAQTSWSRIADSQEVMAKAQRPSAWGAIKYHSGDLWTLRNTSGRSIAVINVATTPPNAGSLLRTEPTVPAMIDPGEHLDLYASARLGLAIRRVRIVWRFADEDDLHDSDRDLTG